MLLCVIMFKEREFGLLCVFTLCLILLICLDVVRCIYDATLIVFIHTYC